MTLVFYSKPDCPLCDDGFERAQMVARRFGMEIKKVNILSDPDLVARHGERIPVLELQGVELGWGRVSEKGLTRKVERFLKT